MAVFRSDSKEWERLDWRLLQNSPITLYFDPSILDSDTAWFVEQSYRVVCFRAVAHASSQDLLAELGGVLGFPEYYGRSLDAFNDCLGDVDVPDDGGLLLVLRDFDILAGDFPDIAQAVLDICADNSRRFLLTGHRFLTLVHTRDPHMSFEPVGAVPAMWNPKEWLNKSRGI